MASSSGVSSESSKLQNSGSDADLNLVMDQRKRKRMLSNRESARRSRMRKQEHMTDLTAQIGLLMKENNQIITSMNVTNQLYMKIEAENSVLRAQMDELTNRLQSLNDILDCINSSKWIYEEEENHNIIGGSDGFLNPWSAGFLNNQPIMASADMFMC
ncbi:bZIP transcription factor 11-like [Pyrus x bretschneideri]|uniref:bZIP transcription factor 11-like n=1 Tax=Pyrus x bretschneideri TaxID=225117 RepID=UPI0020308675|nr:bZIP transcription factor 11-like [Pyrus x bretschneideri]